MFASHFCQQIKELKNKLSEEQEDKVKMEQHR